jgi:hypothetical protein
MTLLLTTLLALGSLATLAAPASAGPACGAPDEQINLVPTYVWYGSGGCYGVHVQPIPPQNCIGGVFVDRPYALVGTSICGYTALLQP